MTTREARPALDCRESILTVGLMSPKKKAVRTKTAARGGRRKAVELLESTRAVEVRARDADPIDSWRQWFQRLAAHDAEAARAAALALGQFALVTCDPFCRDERRDQHDRAWTALGDPRRRRALADELPDQHAWEECEASAGWIRGPTGSAAVVGALVVFREERVDLEVAARVGKAVEFALTGGGKRPRKPAEVARDLRVAIAASLAPWLRGEEASPRVPELPDAYGRVPGRPTQKRGLPREVAALVARVERRELSLWSVHKAARLGHEPAVQALQVVGPSIAREVKRNGPSRSVLDGFLGAEVAAVGAVGVARAVLAHAEGPTATLRRGLDAVDAWLDAPSSVTAQAAYSAVPEALRTRFGAPYHVDPGHVSGLPTSEMATRAALFANLIAARMLQVHLARDDWSAYKRKHPDAGVWRPRNVWCENMEFWAAEGPAQRCAGIARAILGEGALERLMPSLVVRAAEHLLRERTIQV